MMSLVFVVAMAACILVNVADLILLLKYEAKHAGGGGGDEPDWQPAPDDG